MNFEKASDFKGTMKKLSSYIKPYQVKIYLSGILAVIASVMNVLTPWLLGLITTVVANAYKAGEFIGQTPTLIIPLFGNTYTLSEFALLIAIIYLVGAFLNYFQAFLLIGTTQNLTFQMRRELADKINKLPLQFFDNEQSGDILSRMTNDVETINMTLTQSISEIFRSITLFVGIFVMMIILSPILTLIVLVTTVLSLYTVKKFVMLSQIYFRKQAFSNGQLNGHIEETYSGHMIVKVFNHQEKSYERFESINEELYKTSVKSQFISGIMFPVQFFFGNIAYIAIAVVGAFLVLSTDPKIAIGVGVIQAFIMYTRQINQPIQQIGNVANVLQSTAAASERIFKLLEQKDEPVDENESVISNVKGHVVFDQVHFGYTEGTPVIKGFSAEVKPGQKVAIVGPTGAGKTTIVNLLMRFYELNSGKILIDGVPISNMSRSYLRSLFGMVLQDTWLFDGSVKENIVYGAKDVHELDIEKASKLAQTHHFIESLPDGYAFHMGENGENVSQGQRQLLTIARAMLANRPMLILDEATSSVDTRTEVLIQKAMELLMQNRTSFVIAHRLSTIKDADVIFVMNDGNIVEQGNHETLINQNGFYSKLYYSQFDDK
jgi:ATP-binding cassette subfamily B protein